MARSDSMSEDARTTVEVALHRAPDVEHGLAARRLKSEVAERLFGALGSDDPTPRTIGGYEIVDVLARGGMGTVYLARDAKLRREVALKVIAGEPSSRQLREAQALAKLSHPNVVTVFAAGIDDGVVYVAMELRRGGTLREWMKSGPHPWRAVLERFIPAGRGLRAAHEAGLVHRDFKPENVVLDEHGEVAVADFGLAIEDAESEPTDDQGREDALTGSSGDSWFAGTPTYMSPEHMRGAELDGRTDQYAFCVALFEAMVGHVPFRGANFRSLWRAKMRGVVDPGPRPRIPRKLLAAVSRGLRPDPRQRWPDMSALLRELERIAGRRPWRHAVRALAAVSIAGAIAMPWIDVASTPSCSALAAEHGVALQRSADRLEAARSPDEPHYVTTQRNVAIGRVQSWSERWVGEYERTCESARLAGSDPSATLRLHCLDRVRARADALVEAFASTDGRRLTAMAEALPDPNACADAEPPSEVPIRFAEEVETLERVLDRTEAAILTRRNHTNAAAEAGKVLRRAEEIESPGLAARAEYTLARAAMQEGPEGAFEHLRRCYLQAREIGDADLSYGCAQELAGQYVNSKTRPDEASLWLDLAAVEASRSSVVQAAALVRLSRAQHMLAQGDAQAAAELAEAALDELERLPTSSYSLQRAHNTLALAYSSQGRLVLAGDHLREAIAEAIETFGPEHPDVAMMKVNLAGVQLRGGDTQTAIETFSAAREMLRATEGERASDFGLTSVNLGYAYELTGRWSEARAAYEDALAIFEGTPRQAELAHVYTSLGMLALAMGRPHEAIEPLGRAEAIAVELFEPARPERFSIELHLAQAWLAAGRTLDARQRLEELVRRAEQEIPDPELRARTRFALVRALQRSGEPSARARPHALAALAELEQVPEVQGELRREIEAWLAGTSD